MRTTTEPATDPTKGLPVNDPVELEDLVLVRRAQAGDLEAYDMLVRRHQERVYSTVYHMTSNHEDAADLTQDAFIKAYNALRGFKGDCAFFTWIYRIAVNRTLNFLKQRRNRTPNLSLNDLDFNAEHDPDVVALVSEQTPRRQIDLTELQERLNAAMQKPMKKVVSSPAAMVSGCRANEYQNRCDGVIAGHISVDTTG